MLRVRTKVPPEFSPTVPLALVPASESRRATFTEIPSWTFCLRQPVPEDFEMPARCADEVFVPALAHRLERLLRWNAPVHQPEAADPAVFRLEPLDERHLSFAVVRVAGHDLVGEGESVGCKDESDHDLKTVAAFVAAVAVTPEFAFESLRSVDLEVRTREVEEDGVAGRAEEPRPAVAKVVEQLVLEGIPSLRARFPPFVGWPDHAVEAAIERRASGQRAGADQLLDRGVRHPVRVHSELAARIREPVEDDRLHNRKPVRALAARGKPGLPEVVQPELVPENRAEPHLAPVPQVLHHEAVRADANDGAVVGPGSAILGE